MIDKIRKNCDILILFGYNKIIHQNYLNIAKNGILSFHTADINKYRGRPAGFYEFINNEKKGGVTLQQLNNEIDGGKIVEQREIDISNCNSYDETLYKMMSLKNDLVLKGLDKIESNINLKYPNRGVNISINKDSHKIMNVFRCLKKNILRRYFNLK